MSDTLPAFLTHPAHSVGIASAEPVAAAQPATPKPLARGERLDWRRAARLLAEGRRVEDVASAFGVQPDRLHRNLRRSYRFRSRIAAERKAVADETRLRFAALSYDLSVALTDALRKGDPKVLLWVANHLGLEGAGGLGAFSFVPANPGAK
jgi:hypothetical protein